MRYLELKYENGNRAHIVPENVLYLRYYIAGTYMRIPKTSVLEVYIKHQEEPIRMTNISYDSYCRYLEMLKCALMDIDYVPVEDIPILPNETGEY
jgi:hypothetical protein